MPGGDPTGAAATTEPPLGGSHLPPVIYPGGSPSGGGLYRVHHRGRQQHLILISKSSGTDMSMYILDEDTSAYTRAVLPAPLRSGRILLIHLAINLRSI